MQGDVNLVTLDRNNTLLDSTMRALL